MKVKQYHEYTQRRCYDQAEDKFYKVISRDLCIYEGGYLTFNKDPFREEGRVYWLRENNIRIGTVDELPPEIVSALTTPDGEKVLKADLTQGNSPVFLCDMDHRMAVALEGSWMDRRYKGAERVYWPSGTARPISAWNITVSRANRKKALELRQRRDNATQLLDAMIMVYGAPHAIYSPQMESQRAGDIVHGKTTVEELAEGRNLPQLRVLRAGFDHWTNDLLSKVSRTVTQVEYLKF